MTAFLSAAARAALPVSCAILTGCANLGAPPDPGSPAARPQPTAGLPAAAASVPAAVPAAAPPGTAPRPPTAAGANPMPGAAAPTATPPGGLPPLETVIKDATSHSGLFTVWRKDDKTWLELKPEDFDRPFLWSPKISQGIGENGIFGGLMASRWQNFGGPQLVVLQKVHNQVRLVALNTEYTAARGTPEGRAVEAAFSRSLLASAPVVSAAHPTRGTVLVDANPLFVSDVQGLGMLLQRAFRQGYSLDPRHSGIDSVRVTPDVLAVKASNHYYAPNITVPTPGSTPPGAPQPTTPDTLPDVRSLFIGIDYSVGRLPEQPMAPRVADPRVGYFTSTVSDYSNDSLRSPKRWFISRWRLEKKDPDAALSEPVKPIAFWLDRTVPLAYRPAITEGVLLWNRAFEKIGFKDAVRVQLQPDNADFDTLDALAPSIRWQTNAKALYGAIGPSHVDPRTGEILDADIALESLSSRSIRAARAEIVNRPSGAEWGRLMQARDALREGHLEGDAAGPTRAAAPSADACDYADHASEQLMLALDGLAAADGSIDPDSPQVRQFVHDYLVDVTAHEVGHTLGLRHNFRSSRIRTLAELADPAVAAAKGLAGSVMEYAPLNLAADGRATGTTFQKVLGPYDYWAIEYGYKVLPREQENAELLKIAARSAEPELAYGTDEDNSLGVDPESLQMDLGDDPVAFTRGRIAMARAILARQESRVMDANKDYAVLRRAVSFALRESGRAAGIAARQIGGIRTLRDFPGSGRDPMLPVDAAVQRAAFEVLAADVFAPRSLQISAALQRRLAPDFMERGDGPPGPTTETDFDFEQQLVGLRRALLTQLMSDGVAGRLLDSPAKLPVGKSAFTLAELYQRLTDTIWSELAAGGNEIGVGRRELQRDHVTRLAQLVLRPAASGRADQQSLVRTQARALLARIQTASARASLAPTTRAHLAASADTLRQALEARTVRTGA